MVRNLFILLVLVWVASACNTTKPDLVIQSVELKTVEVDGKQVTCLKPAPGQNTFSHVVKFKIKNRNYKVGMVFNGKDVDENFMVSGYIRNPNLVKEVVHDPNDPNPPPEVDYMVAKLYFVPDYNTYLVEKNNTVVKAGSSNPDELLVDVTTPEDPNDPPTVMQIGETISLEETVFFTSPWTSKKMTDPKTGEVVNPKPLELVLIVDSTKVIDEYTKKNNKKAVEIYIPFTP